MPSESEEETEPEEERPNETSPIIEFGGPNVPAPVTKTAELKLNQPKPFTGKRNEIDDFLQDVALYFEINDEIYNTDKKKIGYTLTFMIGTREMPNRGKRNTSEMLSQTQDSILGHGRTS